ESHTGGAGANDDIVSLNYIPRHSAASRTLNWPLTRVLDRNDADLQPNIVLLLPGVDLCNRDIRRTITPAKSTLAALLDHLIGARKQRRGKFEAEPLGSLQIDDQFERCRSFC